MRSRVTAAMLAVLLLGGGMLTGCGQAVADVDGEPMPAATTAPVTPTATPSPTPTATLEPPGTAAPELVDPNPAAVTVTKVIDGDTIDTTVGRIRVIGIDTPERGECNFGPATSLLKRLIAEAGNQVVLTGVSDKDDIDRYGRLLRYIDSPDGIDLGRELIASGYAIARYDSRDGYGAHPREADYVALDAAVPQIPCPGAPTG